MGSTEQLRKKKLNKKNESLTFNNEIYEEILSVFRCF